MSEEEIYIVKKLRDISKATPYSHADILKAVEAVLYLQLEIQGDMYTAIKLIKENL